MKKVHVHIHRTRDADLTTLKTKRNKLDSEITRTQRKNASDAGPPEALKARAQQSADNTGKKMAIYNLNPVGSPMYVIRLDDGKPGAVMSFTPKG